MQKIILGLIVTVLFTLGYFFFQSLSGNAKFQNYDAIMSSSRFFTWVPEYFPKDAKNINISTNVDITEFLIRFYLSPDAQEEFEANLLNKTLYFRKREVLNLTTSSELSVYIKSWCLPFGHGSSGFYTVLRTNETDFYEIKGVVTLDRCKELAE